MASREERMQQRLRGVLRREIKDVDFDLVFSVASKSNPPALSQQSTKLSPDISPASPITTQRTPANQSSHVSDVISSNSLENTSSTISQTANANTSKKRKRLSDNDQTPSLRITRSSRKEKASPQKLYSENLSDKTSSKYITEASQEKGSPSLDTFPDRPLTSSKTPLKTRGAFEVTESPENAPGSGQLVQKNETISSSSQSQNVQKNYSDKRAVKNTSFSTSKKKKDEIFNQSLNTSSQAAHSQSSKDDGIDQVSSESSTRPRRRELRRSFVTESSQIEINKGEQVVDIDEELDELSPDQLPRQKRKEFKHSLKSGSPQIEVNKGEPINNIDEELDELSPYQLSRQKRKKMKQSLVTNSSQIETSQEELIVDINDELDELSPERLTREKHKKSKDSLGTGSSETKTTEENLDRTTIKRKAMVIPKTVEDRKNERLMVESPDLDMPSTDSLEKNKPKNKKKSNSEFSNPGKNAATLKPKSTMVKSKYKSKTRSESPIPITVHRVSTPLIHRDDSVDTKILNMEIPHTKRADVNCLDVLNYVCQEIIKGNILKLKDRTEFCEDMALKKENKVKLQAVKDFKIELEDRLLEYSLDLDNIHVLERRLRDEQKQKIKLRREILRIRADREQVALRMDEIRAQHLKEQQESTIRDSLNNAIHDLDMAMDMGRDNFPNSANDATDIQGTEVLLKKITDNLSSKSSSGGLLRQVREFNYLLERAAMALEVGVR